ncbi:MAG: flagellar hook-length control protein FliK [Spirochaetes bacterium]|nr:flagellar hook-length control protein FliK [Spirochaetota bacterium]MBU1081731.1 flagellar hook-length control protein FliK [Spirochaetota bacterium]
MLALPRIVAPEGGLGAAHRSPRASKSTLPVESPFLKLLAGLRSGKADRPAGANAAPEAKLATRSVSADTRAAGSAAARANGGAALAERNPNGAAKAAGSVREAREAREAGSRLVPKAGAVDGDLARHATRRTGTEKSNKGASDGIEASMAAGASLAAAPMPKGTEKANAQAWRSSADADANRSGIETLGAHTERGKDGAKVTVMDMRLKASRELASKRNETKAGAQGESQQEATKSEVRGASQDPSALAGRVFSREDGPSGSPAQAPAEAAPAAPKSFAESLATRLRDGAADIVRSAQVVLRDGDSGIIRLRLEPESLGGVKIELKMTEKQISGKIVVESDIAGDAFRASIDALKDAFAESGFETTALEVEVRNGMASGSGEGRGRREGDESAGAYRSRSLRELSEAVPSLSQPGREGALNVIV